MYKAILFDLDDTLWDCESNVLDSFKEVYHDFALGNYFDSFDHFYGLYQPFNQLCWKKYSSGLIDKATLNKDRFNYPFKMVGMTDEVFVEHFMNTYFKLVPTKSKLMPGAIEALEYLYKKYPLYIVSNGFTEMQYQKMESGGITHYFKQVFLSDEIGVNKPDKRIFQFVLNAIQLNPSEVVMIGDNYDTDIVGAKNSGIDQIHLDIYTNGDKITSCASWVLPKISDVVNIL